MLFLAVGCQESSYCLNRSVDGAWRQNNSFIGGIGMEFGAWFGKIMYCMVDRIEYGRWSFGRSMELGAKSRSCFAA